MRAVMMVLVVVAMGTVAGCEKNVKEGVNQRAVPSEVASAK
jgi:hypothetical protein